MAGVDNQIIVNDLERFVIFRDREDYLQNERDYVNVAKLFEGKFVRLKNGEDDVFRIEDINRMNQKAWVWGIGKGSVRWVSCCEIGDSIVGF